MWVTEETALPRRDDRKDREANIKQAEAQVRAAASLGAQVVVLNNKGYVVLKI